MRVNTWFCMSESRRASPWFTRRRISSSVTRGAVTTYSGRVPAARRIVSSTASTGAACAALAASPATRARKTRSLPRAVISEHAEFEILLGILLHVEQQRVQALEAPRELVVELGVVEDAARAPLPRRRQAEERVRPRGGAVQRFVQARIGGHEAERSLSAVQASDECVDLHRHGREGLRGLALARVEVVGQDPHFARHTVKVVVEFPVVDEKS